MNIISLDGVIEQNDYHSFHFEDGFTCAIKYELKIIEEVDANCHNDTVFYIDFSKRKVAKKRVVRLALHNINLKGEEYSLYHYFGNLIFRFDEVKCIDVLIQGNSGLFIDSLFKILKFIHSSPEKPLFVVEKEIAVNTSILISKTFLTSYVDMIRQAENLI